MTDRPDPDPEQFAGTLMDGLENEPPYDPVDRRVASILYTAFDRAHPKQPNRERENDCPKCRGDGCEVCAWSGEVAA